jgi:hypothetical protein
MSYSIAKGATHVLEDLYFITKIVAVYLMETVFQDFNFKQISGTNTTIGISFVLYV